MKSQIKNSHDTTIMAADKNPTSKGDFAILYI